jgi:galactonate dehydratase
MNVDLSFRIASVRSARVRVPGPDYWRGFLQPQAAGDAAGRFQFSPPWRTVYAREVESALVRVELSDGSVGWGEATCPIAPEVVCVLLDGFVAQLVQGRDFGSPAALVDMLYDAQRCRGYLAGHAQDAAAALDIALHDALARRAGCPVARLFTDAPLATVPCYLSGARAPSRPERVALLQQWSQTARAAKIFLRGDLDADLEELAALQQGATAIDWWAVDALWTYADVPVATRARQAFAALGARWLECPMLPEDLAGHAALRDVPGAAIALGEHFRTPLQFEPWLEAGLVQVLQPDIGRTGFVAGRRMLAAAAQRGVAVTPHMGGALDVMQAATLHFAAAAGSDLPCEYQEGLANRIPAALRSHWRVQPGGFALPEVPGLGVEVDEDALQRFVVA